MGNPNLIDQLSEALRQVLPDDVGSELQKNIRAAIQGGLDRAGVVTREEIEIQEAVLDRTRKKLEALEQQLLALEQKQSQNS